jgi:hypothetical protein
MEVACFDCTEECGLDWRSHSVVQILNEVFSGWQMALVVARAVVGARVLSEALFSCFEFCADWFVNDTDARQVVVSSYIVGGAVGGPVGTAWRIASG